MSEIPFGFGKPGDPEDGPGSAVPRAPVANLVAVRKRVWRRRRRRRGCTDPGGGLVSAGSAISVAPTFPVRCTDSPT